MGYTNPIQVLTAAVMYPAAIEAMLPAGAPKISAMLTDATGKLPALPDFPTEVPDLPAPPAAPALPGGLKRPTAARGGVREVVFQAPTVGARVGKTRFLY